MDKVCSTGAFWWWYVVYYNIGIVLTHVFVSYIARKSLTIALKPHSCHTPHKPWPHWVVPFTNSIHPFLLLSSILISPFSSVNSCLLSRVTKCHWNQSAFQRGINSSHHQNHFKMHLLYIIKVTSTRCSSYSQFIIMCSISEKTKTFAVVNYLMSVLLIVRFTNLP